jgi:epoxide hydrolase-like predicted phosphatase
VTQRLQGLIVDWGGVLTPSLDAAMAAWAQADGVDFEHFRDVMRAWVGPRPTDGPGGDPPGPDPGAPRPEGPVALLAEAPDAAGAASSPVHRLERGELTPAEFEQELAERLTEQGSPVAAQGLLGRMLAGLAQLDHGMLGMVRRAHDAGVRTALLSNSWGDHYPDELFDGIFDAVVISGRVGMRKPDAEIFRHTAELLGLDPAACVMVDDLPQNVRGAVAAGMVAVQHTDVDSTRAELEVLLGLDLVAQPEKSASPRTAGTGPGTSASP